MTRPTRKASPIPQFALYGETVISHKPEFAHIEDIRERSLRNGWVIKPHRHTHLFQILCMVSGAAEVRLDTNSSTHSGRCIITIPPGVVHGFRFRPETQGVVLSLAIGMPGLDIESSLGHQLGYAPAQARIIGLEKASPLFEDLYQYMALVRKELSAPLDNQEMALHSLIKLVLVSLGRLLQLEQMKGAESVTGIQLAVGFRGLLEQHYKEHWKIGDYAESLDVSISTLNRACIEALGNSAKKLVQERLHIEAKRRLIYTLETSEQISCDLGFKNAAYFSRCFKRLEGMAPNSFRMSANSRHSWSSQP